MAYRADVIRYLGITQIVLGSLMIIFGIASLAGVHHWSSDVASGIWIGLWVLLTGLFGYFGGKSDTTPNKCLIGVMMGFAITACVVAPIMLIIYSIALSQFSASVNCKWSSEICNDKYSFYDADLTVSHAKVGIVMGAFLVILSISEFFIALTSSIYVCNAFCCTTPNNQPPTQIAYIGPQQGNVVTPSAGNTASSVQTVTSYPGQAMPVIYQQQAVPQGQVYHQQGVPQGQVYHQQGVPQGQVYHQQGVPQSQIVYNIPPQAQVPVPPNYAAFQAQQNTDAEKPPPYTIPQ